MGAFRDIMKYLPGNSEAKEKRSFSSLPKPCSIIMADVFSGFSTDDSSEEEVIEAGLKTCSSDNLFFSIRDKIKMPQGTILTAFLI